MSAMLANLAASRRRSLQLVDFCKMRTTLPDNVIAWNGTYTRNSVKTVVQDGALVTLSANQFGTSYDDVTGLYGYVPEPAATNICLRSTLEGGGAAPTGWTQPTGTGSSTPVASSLGSASGAVAYLQTASNERPYLRQTVSVSANTTYTASVWVESITASKQAQYFLTALSLPAGATLTYPACQANPSGGETGILTTGRLSITITTAGTAGTAEVRIGAGTTSVVSATIQFSRPQVETGLRATSYIATTGSTASRAADVLSIPLWVNNLKDSQDGGTGNWTRTNCTVSTSGTAPDGTSTAQLVTCSSTASTSLINNSTKAPSAVVTASCYLKKGNRTGIHLLLRNTTTSTNFTLGLFNADTGAISGSGWSSQDAGNGWWRCSFTQSTGISVGDALSIYPVFAATTYTSGDTGYYWGAQIEAGSTATAYRPTTSTLKSVANRNIPNFDSDGYALFADIRMDATLAASTGAVEVSNAYSSDRAPIYAGGGTTPTVSMTSGSVTQAVLNGSSFGFTRSKFSGSFAVNSVLGTKNGTAMTADTSAAMPSGLTMLHLGSAFNSQLQFNGFIFSAGLIPQVLTQAQINGLTTL